MSVHFKLYMCWFSKYMGPVVTYTICCLCFVSPLNYFVSPPKYSDPPQILGTRGDVPPSFKILARALICSKYLIVYV